MLNFREVNISNSIIVKMLQELEHFASQEQNKCFPLYFQKLKVSEVSRCLCGWKD